VKNEIIAAVRNDIELNKAIESRVTTIFYLTPNILTLSKILKKVHEAGKRLFVHIDLAEGVGKDKAGIKLLKKLGVDGIISTRVNIIKLAKNEEIFTVQRFFIVDSQSVDTTVESVKQSKCDVIEIMPGVVPKVISTLKGKISVPIIAGGLIETEEEIRSAFKNGALAISTGKDLFWDFS